MKQLTWALALLCLPAMGKASPTPTPGDSLLHLSLHEVWDLAAQHSRAVAMKNKQVAIRGESLKDAQAERFPEVDIAGNYEKATNIPVYDNGLFHTPSQHEVIHTLYKVGADFYLNLYNGNKLNLKIAEEKVAQQIAGIQQQQTLSDIRYAATAGYLELQKSMVYKQLVLADIENQEKQLEEIRENYRDGVVLKSDVLRVELDLSRRKLLLVQIDNDILLANQQLNILIGEDDERPVMPDSIPMSDFTTATYEQYLQTAMEHAFSYHISEQETQLRKIALQQVKANVSPKIGLYGDFYYANPQIFLYPYNPHLYSLGISGVRASFPLSSLYHNPHKVKEAALELEKEEIAHQDVADKIRQQVKAAYLRYQEALVQIQVAKANIDQATENARIIKNTYFNHTSLITDLLDADVQVLQTRFELVAARVAAQNKYYLLQNVIGTL
ncbi:TolC family protein [Chitinophaga parva]|uniref:TolC family protein n=1 Tax=Chitinophaga parva TaxID=2169414 RepID=A0A2T7BCJ4_9BACT|nr:TolC family protein [Chitinophaga parva]PUZ22818.1 TolC family protein [Chitinophaga parva]